MRAQRGASCDAISKDEQNWTAGACWNYMQVWQKQWEGHAKVEKKIVDTASARRYQFQNFEIFLAVPRNGIKLSPRTLEQNSLGNAQGTTEKNMWILASLQLQASICWKSGALKATPH